MRLPSFALRSVFTLAVLLGLAHGGAQAQASLPYTPSAAARGALGLLVDQGRLQLPLSHWPLPARAVQRALDELPVAAQDASLDAARALVRAELQRLGESRLQVRLARRADALTGLGDDSHPGSGLRLRSARLGDGPGNSSGKDSGNATGDGSGTPSAVVGQIGLRLDADPSPPGDRRAGARLRLDDTAVVGEALGVQLQASTRSAWWGPGWQSSLILGNAMPDLATLSLQRASAGASASPWLAWLGPWTAEAFVAQAEVSSTAAPDPAYAWVIGQRLTFMPRPGLEVGLSRTAQWGGRGRSNGLRSFANMLLGRSTNADTLGAQAADPGNQMAGVDVRLRCPEGLSCAVYAQLVGEDMAGILPSRYLSLYGLEYWPAGGAQRVYVEYADSACDSTPDAPRRALDCAYRNGQYPLGYQSAGRWLGASQGPDVRLLSIGLVDGRSGLRLRGDLGWLSHDPAGQLPIYAQAPEALAAGRLVQLRAEQSLALAGGELTPKLSWQRVSGPSGSDADWSAGVNWSTTLDGGRGLGDWAARRNQVSPALTAAAWLTLGLALDRPADRYAQDHGANPSMRLWTRSAAALPVLALGLAGGHSVWHRGSQAGDTALTSVEAGLAAYASTVALKSALGRDRPASGLGPASFGQDASRSRRDSSLPSNHAAMAWAVLTPYAKAYDLPGLYGLAAAVSAGRVMGREHWASDAIAGSLLGYHLANWLVQRGPVGASTGPQGVRLSIWGSGAALQMPLP